MSVIHFFESQVVLLLVLRGLRLHLQLSQLLVYLA
jgi:hypothetical protein